MLDFRILGSLEVLRGNEAIVLRRQKQHTLLALLLLSAGDLVSADRLIEEVWASRPPATARASLHNFVSQLRKALGVNIITTHASGYVFNVRVEQTDVGRFQRLVEDAHATATLEPRASKLRNALALWRGSALADVWPTPSIELEAACLDERRISTVEDLIDAELQLGRAAQLVPTLERLVTNEPFRERLRGQLMLALYRSGRQAAALESFQQARAMLIAGLGLEPSPALRELERAILNHDPWLERLPARPALLPEQPRIVTFGCAAWSRRPRRSDGACSLRSRCRRGHR
jgi:DNA-binding SARP family transcriptional activator